jgi:outer membrane protein assembly factor BamB
LGWIHAVERTSGDELWRMPVGDHENDELTELPPDEEVFVLPGVWGGVESPLAFADGVVYAQVINLGTPWTATGYDAADDAPGQAVAAAEGRTRIETADSLMVALDVATGEVLWETPWDNASFGGATVVNDLVITADLDGTVRAFDRDDGSEVWTTSLDGGVNAWPAIAGDTVVWPVGTGPEPRLVALRLAGGG